MFHPNVYADGSICLDILQNRWSPTYDVSSILTSIQSLLDEPNPNSPANSQAAQLYQENKREYEKRVSAIVEQSWRDCWLRVEQTKRLAIRKMYIDEFIYFLFLIHYIYFIKNKIAVVLFLLPLPSFSPFCPPVEHQRFHLKSNVLYLGYLQTLLLHMSLCCISFPTSSLQAVIRLLYFLY